MAKHDTDTLLSISGISKSFGSTRALCDVSLNLCRGEIHGLVGVNGSGKSTLIKILAGYYAPDVNAQMIFRIGNDDARPWSSSDRHLASRLAFVHQDLAMIDGISIVDNMRMGLYKGGILWHIDWEDEYRKVNNILKFLGIRADARDSISSLDQVDRVRLAIARAIDLIGDADGGGIVVLDEPTAAMPKDEAGRLLDTMREVSEAGNAVLFVSHHLSEVVDVADRVTVLRNGSIVATVEEHELNEEFLVGAMVGGVLPMEKQPSVTSGVGSRVVLRCEGLRGRLIEEFTCSVMAGEVVGVTGLSGSGFEEIPYLMIGAVGSAEGTMWIEEQECILGRTSIGEFVKTGLVLVPGDRRRSGMVDRLSIRENVSLPRISKFRLRGVLSMVRERDYAESLIQEYSVQAHSIEQDMGTLSGGNQQRAIMAKWIATKPRVLVVHEPVQGVDIGAKMGIFRVLRETAQRGCAVVIASSEAKDLADICDRVIIIWHGEVAQVLVGADVNEGRIVFESSVKRGDGVALN